MHEKTTQFQTIKKETFNFIARKTSRKKLYVHDPIKNLMLLIEIYS